MHRTAIVPTSGLDAPRLRPPKDEVSSGAGVGDNRRATKLRGHGAPTKRPGSHLEHPSCLCRNEESDLRLTGVPITEPRHPILISPFAQRRRVPEIPVTDELRAIIDKAKSEFPL
jgi:hypothetical protein